MWCKNERVIVGQFSCAGTDKASLLVAFVTLLGGCGLAEKGPEQAALEPSTTALGLQLRAEAETVGERGVAELIANDAAMHLGERLFEARCASCHGLDAPPGRGVPDLRTHRFNYGDGEQAVRETVSQGRLSVMPRMGHDLGEVDLGQLVAFVRSLDFESPLSSYAERGKKLFAENCASCHGADGFGNPELGASNLTDGYWQHGDAMMNIRLVITRGVQAQCAGYPEASEAEIALLTAYVLRSIESRDPLHFEPASGLPWPVIGDTHSQDAR